MSNENDQPEAAQVQQIEQNQLESNDLARRRILERREDLLNCEHVGEATGEATAIDRSARLMDQWETTKDSVARRQLLEGVGREMMAVHEAPPGPIHLKEMPRNELGAYVDDDFRTDVNEWQLKQDNPRDALETYLHEYRHAEQHYEVQKSHGVAGPSVNRERASAVEHNLDKNNYISPEENHAAYERQLVERDAETFGTTAATEILERRNMLRALDHSNAALISDSDVIAHLRIASEKGTKT